MRNAILIMLGGVGTAAMLLAAEPEQRKLSEVANAAVLAQQIPVPKEDWVRGLWDGRRPPVDRLFAGQRVQLDRAVTGGFNVIILDQGLEERDFKEFGFEPATILRAGEGSVLILDESGVKQIIASHLIHLVTEYPADQQEKGEAANAEFR